MDAKSNKHPKITAISAVGGAVLHIVWDNRLAHDVDLGGLAADHAALAPVVADPTLFAQVAPGDWGWCAHWTDDVEVSSATLWTMALRQDGKEFREWRKARDMTQDGAAEALGLSHRMVKYYEAGEHAIPKTVKLAMRGYDVLTTAAE